MPMRSGEGTTVLVEAALEAELVATGTELLSGRTVNTHARLLGARLPDIGFRLRRETTVGDDEADIALAVRDALARVPVVVISGGLGPTSDDRTREAVAALLRRPVQIDEGVLEHLRRLYAARGRELTALRRRQALVIAGAVILANRAGAAPGQMLETDDGRLLFLLPGPPSEFRAVLEDEVLPRLQQRYPQARSLPRHVFQLCGIPEADAAERLNAAGFVAAPLELAWRAAPGRLEIRLTGRAGEDALVAARAEEIRRTLAPYIFAEGMEDLPEAVGRLLESRRATVAVAESCTGGGIGATLTGVPGSSAWFRGGVIAYANEVKRTLLDVPAELLAREGAVSAAVAEQMARAVRIRLGADYGLAVTGIAGPSGGTAEKPVGLVYIACADRAGCEVQRHHFPGDRENVRAWSSAYALNLLRLRLLGTTLP